MAETNVKNTSAPFGQKSPFAPTQAPQDRKKRRGNASEYKKSLQEKQTLKRLYGLSERQFKKYVVETLERRHKVENVSDELIQKLERRLDNVVFRLGFAKTRRQARQLVSHAYFMVNGRAVNIPSFKVSKEDSVTIKENKKKKGIFKELSDSIKKMETPTWLKLNKDNLEAKIVGNPTLAEVNPPVEISLIFEFYSR